MICNIASWCKTIVQCWHVVKIESDDFFFSREVLASLHEYDLLMPCELFLLKYSYFREVAKKLINQMSWGWRLHVCADISIKKLYILWCRKWQKGHKKNYVRNMKNLSDLPKQYLTLTSPTWSVSLHPASRVARKANESWSRGPGQDRREWTEWKCGTWGINAKHWNGIWKG